MQKWPDLVGPHTCIESPSKLLLSGRAEIRKCSGPRAPWGKSCKSICDWPHPQRRPNKSRRTRSALSNGRSGVTYCIPFCWIFTNKYQCKKWGFFTFSQSRLSVVFWRFPPCLAQHAWLCPYFTVVPEGNARGEVEGLWRAVRPCQIKKLGRTKESDIRKLSELSGQTCPVGMQTALPTSAVSAEKPGGLWRAGPEARIKLVLFLLSPFLLAILPRVSERADRLASGIRFRWSLNLLFCLLLFKCKLSWTKKGETTDNFLVSIDSRVIFEEILRLVKGTKNCSIGLTNWHQRNSEETEENSRLWSSKWEFICCPNEYPYSKSSNHTTNFGPGLIVHQQYKKYFLMK